MGFTAIPARRLYQEVADQIARLVRAGNYGPGDRLPPERNLSQQLRVSRPVVREAMIALEIAGIVEVRGGSGVYIRDLSASSGAIDQGEGPYEIFVARRAFEGEIAAAAALNWKEPHLVELREALEHLRIEGHAGPAAAQADRRFHLAIAMASGNSVYVQTLRFIWDELQLNHSLIWDKLRERRAIRPTRFEEHAAVADAIAKRDADEARHAMHVHFDGSIGDFLDMTASDGPPSSAPLPAISASA